MSIKTESMTRAVQRRGHFMFKLFRISFPLRTKLTNNKIIPCTASCLFIFPFTNQAYPSTLIESSFKEKQVENIERAY